MAECISKVYLLNVPFENDYLHTWYFDGKDKAERKSKQEKYFLSKVIAKHKYTDFSYQRKDSSIRIPAQYDDVLGCNYVMYQNTAYGADRWFYAFITDIKYVSDGRTDITIETDVLQTWMFDYDVKDSFIEREHVDDDTIGLHTIPEGLETGPYLYKAGESFEMFPYKNTENTGIEYVIFSTVDLMGEGVEMGSVKFEKTRGGMYNGIPSGAGAYAYTKYSAALQALEAADHHGQGDAIMSMFIAPSWLTNKGDEGVASYSYKVKDSLTSANKSWSVPVLFKDSVDGYKPKNKKLLTHPYKIIKVVNHAGSYAEYRPELFPQQDTIHFNVLGALTPGCSIRLIPLGYADDAINYEEGLTAGKLPVCCWNSDVYTNWLTQNSANIGTEYVSSAVSIIGGIALAAATHGASAIAGGLMAASGVTSIASTQAKIYEHSCQPPQARGNVNSGDVTFSHRLSTFTVYFMSIKEEYAKKCDNFFTMFGYKVDKLGKPLTNHRKRFWYTKTIDVNIDGDVPHKDLQKIKECYNKGITFWKYGSGSMGDYLSDNNISGE